MQFSVVIPVYNREHLIQDALESVLDQTHDNYEIIVVDDGSTDGTCEAIRKYGDKVRLIVQENAGPGAARNRGIRASSGEYVAFLDSDDRWFPWTLSTYSNVIRRFGKPSYVKAPRVSFHTEKDLVGTEKQPITADHFEDFCEAAGRGIWVGSGVSVIKRASIEKVGGFTTQNINAEDHDLAFRLGTQPGFVRIQSPPLVAVRNHNDQESKKFKKIAEGFTCLVNREESGMYPGGRQRREERRYLLCQHIRSATVSLVHRGYPKKAFELYWRSLMWQISFRRVKYIIGLPVIIICRYFRDYIK